MSSFSPASRRPVASSIRIHDFAATAGAGGIAAVVASAAGLPAQSRVKARPTDMRRVRFVAARTMEATMRDMGDKLQLLRGVGGVGQRGL
jgi:hypothetical protein